MPRNAATNRLKLREIPSSLSFNGSTTTVAYSGAGVTGFASASSFAGWVKIAKGSGTTRIIVGRWGTGGSDRCAICFQQVSPLGSENYALQAGYYNGSTYTVSGTTNVPIETWFHLAYTWDGTTSRSYINGTLLTGTSASPASGATTGLSLGNQSGANWRGNQSMVKLYTRVLTQDEITKLSLMQDDQVDTTGLWVDWHLDEGAGSSVTDYSGNSRTGTITSGAFVYDSPMKARKLINANMVKNGDFEYAPPFTAATTTDSRWIDGTAAGSTTNDLFQFAFSRTGSNGQAYFDTTVTRNSESLASMKVSTTGVNTLARARTLRVVDAPNVLAYGIPLSPNTSYTLSGWMKTAYVSGDATTGAFFRVSERTASSTQLATNDTTYIKVTSDWTRYITTFTTNASTRYGEIQLLVEGNIGTATLIMDAWFDDIVLTPVYPEGRVPANGNLVKNFDFEVAPTFVAVPGTTTRWIDGTSAGSTTNSTYKWAIDFSGTVSCRFDPTTFYAGSSSMKLSTTAVASWAEISSVRGTPTVLTLPVDGIRMNPGVAYTCRFRMKTNYVSGDATNGAALIVQEYNAAAAQVASTISTYIKTTTDWTEYELSFTSNAATQYARIQMRLYGHQGAATLIMDAWFDDIYLAPTTNPGRVVIT